MAARGRLKDLQASVPVVTSPCTPKQWISSEISTIQSIGGYSLQKWVDYYDKVLASMFVWVDCDDNLYRRHVLPLTRINPAVRLAVAAVSAQHASSSRGGHLVPEDARNEAIAIITKHINEVTDQIMDGNDLGKGLDIDAAEWILASMLVLSSYEMAHSGAAAADFHRNAARSLINTLSTTPGRKSEFLVLLRNKLATYDIFACTTSFELSTIRDAILPDPDNEILEPNETSLFSGYLRLLHELTVFGRQNPNIRDTHRDWRGELEIAMGETLITVGGLPIQDAQQRRDLIRVVQIHHNSALLYARRILGHECNEESGTALTDLKRQILALEDLNRWIHNLPWPFFIAGVESHGNFRNQEMVRKLFSTVSEITGLRQYRDDLEFLNIFWSGDNPDWQVLGREWEQQGRRILAF